MQRTLTALAIDSTLKPDNEVLTTKLFMDAVAKATKLTMSDGFVLLDLATRNAEQNMFIIDFVL